MLDKINNDILVTIIAGSLLLFMLSVFIVAFTALFLRKRKQYKIEKQLRESQFSEILLQSQLDIREQTLQHIAYELHDNLGQVASLIKINLNTIRLEDRARSIQTIEDTKELIRQLILDLKSISLSLNSDRIAQLGIQKGLEGEVQRLNKSGEFEASLEVRGQVPELDSNTTTILFRMMQEIINNAVKHSGAKHIAISMRATENLFTLVCTDNGVGFNDDALKTESSGLINLRNRTRMINGKIHINSLVEQGTTIVIELPLLTSHDTSIPN